MINYDMTKLNSVGEFNASVAEMNFNSRQDYFDKLTEFVSSSREYLRSYNPTVVIYGAEARNEFMIELKKVERMLKILEMPAAISELRNLEEAVLSDSVTALSDGMVKFGAQMEILNRSILSTCVSAVSAYEKLMIFIVDENPMILSIISSILHDDYRPVCVTNSQDAIDQLKRNTPALLLLDADMPDMKGFELASKIREDSKFKSTPILFLTSTVSRENVMHASSCGASGHVLKPVNKDYLLAMLKACLGR